MPSTRTLASNLGVARGTIVEAYAQLAAEGWLLTRPGGATVVSFTAREATRQLVTEPASETGIRHDLRPGEPDLWSFPTSTWLAAQRRATRNSPVSALGYDDVAPGALELRTELVRYLARARGVVAEPEQIVICSGFTDALASIGRCFADGVIAVEDPSLPYHRTIAAHGGAHITALTVDDEGASSDPGQAQAAVITPAHQYPLGMALTANRRAGLIDWARRSGGLIIEDDYDGEFRFDREPLSAVQGLDPEQVVYVGTVSKSLAPALRIGWVVLPERFRSAFLSQRVGVRSVPVLDQLALAELIRSGAFDRHLHRVRSTYRRRRDELIEMLPSIDPSLTVGGIAAGLHAVVDLGVGGVSESAVLEQAIARGVGVEVLSSYWMGSARAEGLVIGYSRPANHNWKSALDALRDVLRATIAA